MKSAFKLILAAFAAISFSHANESHTIWWEECLGKDVPFSTFEGWLGDMDATTRVAFRKEVHEKGFKAILDVPGGLAIDYYGLKKDNIDAAYTGVDITPSLVKLAKDQGIDFVEGDIENLPFHDNKFEISHARHILEHLDAYEKAISELIRVSSKEVFITFFIKPQKATIINLNRCNEYLLYHNTYSKNEIETFVKNNPKVSDVEWVDMPNGEIILKVFLDLLILN